MKTISEKQAIALLLKHSSSKKDYDKVLAHCRAVQKVAIQISRKINKKAKKEIINLTFVCRRVHGRRITIIYIIVVI